MLPYQFFELFIKLDACIRLLKRLPLIHQLDLNPQRYRLILNQMRKNSPRHFGRVVVSNHLSALVNHGLEESFVCHELLLTVFAKVWFNLLPSIRYDYNVLESIFAAKLTEHPKISGSYTSHTDVSDTVHVDDAVETLTGFVPGIMS